MAAKRVYAAGDHDIENIQNFPENTVSGLSVPAFVAKLWTLVEDPSNNDIICWDPKGTSFHIFDQSRFSSEVLPFYFKHNQFSSFIRQLNMYGFRKVQSVEHGTLKVEKDDFQFQHQFFIHGREELLDNIKRKSGQNRTEQRALNHESDGVKKLLNVVAQIKSKQDNVNVTVDDLKRENKILWQEVIKMKSKQKQQEQIVNKLLQFLLSLVNKHGRGMTSLPRKRPLMIDGPPQHPSQDENVSPPKRSHIHLETPMDHDYTVESPSIIQTPTTPSTSGVVIQELLDNLDPPSISAKQASSTSVTCPSNDTMFTSSSQLPAPSAVLPAKAVNQNLLTNQLPSTSYLESYLAAPTTSTVMQHQQSLPQPSESTSNQIALRGAKDTPLSASCNSTDVFDQMSQMQNDLDSVRDALSSGQFSLDSTFIMNLFDPEAPLSMALDPSVLDSLQVDSSNATNAGSSSLDTPSFTVAPENISGNELLQYQPTELDYPSLFEELDSDAVGTNNALSFLLDNSTNSGTLDTPPPHLPDEKPDFLRNDDFVPSKDSS